MLRRRAWQLYLGAGLILSVLYMTVPPLKGSGPLMNVLGLSTVLAIPLALKLHRPASRAPWWWCTLGFALFWLGDLYTYSYPHLLHREVPFPSLGDGAYLLVYPALMAGLMMIVRRRNARTETSGLIDAAILTIGLSLPSWVALMAPYLHDHEMATIGKIVSVAYPVGDILLLAAAVRLALDSGRREPAFYLLTSSIVLLLMTDFMYGVMTLNGTYTHQLWLDLGWIGFYLLWAAAALHPSMPGLEQQDDDRQPVLTRFRLALLTLASFVAPAISLLARIREGDLDMSVVSIGSLMLFGFVVVRMAGLVRQQEASVARERTLSGAGGRLVAATTQEEIDSVAKQAAADLLDRSAQVVFAPPGKSPVGWFDVPVAPRRGEPRLLCVTTDPSPTAAEQAALSALALQVALALDGVVLSQEIHRRRSEARFGSLVQHSSDLITVIAPDGTVTYQSPSIERVLGYTPEEVTGLPFDRLIVGSDRTRLLAEGAPGAGEAQAFECTLRHRDGTSRQFEILSTNLVDDEHVGGIVLNSRDVSERKAFEDQLTHQAFHDPVTGLANRALFVERVRHATARARRERQGIAVIFLDLDDFKTINDSLGHAAGDDVLSTVARRLSASVRASDTAARFGGDEFAILLEHVEDADEVAETAERILEALATPVRAGHKDVSVHASLGISVADADGTATADEMIRDADAAMYIAKRDGKGGYRLFEPAMHEHVLARLELRTDLQRAIATEQLRLHYQPVVRLQDASVAGVEALLRWEHPERGMVPPDQFIPLAEETGLIVPIGRWVLREGCRAACELFAGLPEGAQASMAINVSLKQFQHSDIVADVREALTESGLPPESLTLEITESVLMADADLAVERLVELKKLGVRLALDDFGTGYSSLSHLSRFPVDILKMDRSFLREDAVPGGADLTTAVMALGSTLGMEVVAEGIELIEQWHALRDLGCSLGQGFYFARPMDAQATLAFLTGQGLARASASDAA